MIMFKPLIKRPFNKKNYFSPKPFFHKKKEPAQFSMFKEHWKRHKTLDIAYSGYIKKKKLGIWSTEPKHFFLFRAWGYTREEQKKKVDHIINNSLNYLKKGVKFKKNRSKKQYKKIFSLLDENKAFWSVSWWKTNSKIVLNPQWDWYLKKLKDIPHRYFYKDLSGADKRLKNFDLKRLNARLIRYFIKNSFKAVFARLLSSEKKFKLGGDANQFFHFYKKMKLIFSSYPKFLALLLKTSSGPADNGAFFLSNLAFSKIYLGAFPQNISRAEVNLSISTPVWSAFRKNLAETHSVVGPISCLHSSYYKINSFILLKYFIVSLGSLFNKKKNIYISQLIELVNAQAQKKLLLEKKNVSVKKNMYRKLYFSLLLAIKNNFFKGFKKNDIIELNKLIINPNQPRLIKNIPGARGFFFFLRKRIPKYFKSVKKLRLFKKYVRSYKYSSRASFNIKNIMGSASYYFQAVGVKKQFKQKIYYRAVFKNMYALKDDKKMYSRWKNVKKSRSKWIGFYNNFEGHLWRAARWLGFSNKVKLSRFLVENGLIFINGKVVTDPKLVVGAHDIVYLRKDIHALQKKKIWNRLTKKALSAVPFYSNLLKQKLIKKASRIAKGLLRKSVYTSKMHNKRLTRYKKILQDANFSIFKKNYAKSYPNLILDRSQWRRHLKKVSSIKLLLAKKMLLNRPVLHSANADYSTYPKNETFYFKKNSSVMVFAKPRSATDFFNTTMMKYKKALNPRSIKDFVERDYKY